MSTAISAGRRLRLGPRSAGLLLTTAEFDRARFREGWRYELINEVLVVSPIPSRMVRNPNGELGYWLRNYQEEHPHGSSLDATIYAETIETKQNRRHADRVIWAGLGRDPEERETPTIVVEFVSAGKVNQERDYLAKRAEYREIGVREYWVIDRFRRTLTIFRFGGDSDQELVISEKENYETPLLPGFVLPLSRSLALADRWAKKKKRS
jgi:Uma2 family endonuclease